MIASLRPVPHRGLIANIQDQIAQVVDEIVLDEGVVVASTVELHGQVVVHDVVRSESVMRAVVQEDPPAVVQDQVRFREGGVHRLIENAVRAEPPVAREDVPLDQDIVRIHQRRSRYIILERVVQEPIVVRVHVMQAIA